MGETKAAIGKAIKDGRITLSNRKGKGGNRLINWETESIAYKANTDATKIRTKRGTKNIKPAKEYKPRVKQKEIVLSEKEEELATREIRKMVAKAGKLEEFIPDIPEIPDATLKDGLPENVKKKIMKAREIAPEIGSVAFNSNRKLAADADRSELKYAAELRQVIPTDVAILLSGSIMTSIKESLLAMPSRTVGLIEATIKTKVEKWKDGEKNAAYNAILNILDNSVKEILEDASRGIEDLPKDVEAYFGRK